MIKKSWNPVFNKIIEIKEKYKKFSDKSQELEFIDYRTDNYSSCIDRWVDELGIQEYKDLIEPLQIVQCGTKILIRYGNYGDIFSGGDDRTYESFWYLYDGFYMECRSATIDIRSEELVATSFRKFRNLNECDETEISKVSKMIKNAKSFEISDKLDGSMQVARYYNDEYFMSGSMALDPKSSWRLKDGYRMLNENEGIKRMLKHCPLYTFTFEYISLNDAHVVKYSKEDEGLHLIGARSMVDGHELSYSELITIANRFNVKVVKVFDKTFEEIVSELDDKKSDEAEGFVVNIDGFKVKVKYNDYVYIHKMISAISSVNLIIKSVADNTLDDLISKVPEIYRERVFKVSDVIFKYIHETNKVVEKIYCDAPKSSKKEFMIYVNSQEPKEIRSYVINLYYGRSNNYLKSHVNTDCPRYKKFKEISDKSYEELFKED